MDFLTITNVAFPFGVEFSRLSLKRILVSKGIIPDDILLDIGSSTALVSCKDSFSTQVSVITIDGLILFGQVLRCCIGAAPFIGASKYFITHHSSSILFVKQFSLLEVLLWARRMKGVITVIPITSSDGVVVTESIATAVEIRNFLIDKFSSEGVCIVFARRSS